MTVDVLCGDMTVYVQCSDMTVQVLCVGWRADNEYNDCRPGQSLVLMSHRLQSSIQSTVVLY